MDEEEYAIVSKKEFLALKRELDKIKKNPLEGSEHGDTLQASLDNLNKSLNTMLEVFKQAADEMKLEEHDTELVAKQIGPINDKLDTLIDQNQKIAKGIVAVADMVREKLEEIEEKTSHPRLSPLTGPKPAHAEPSLPGPMPPPPSGPMPPPGGPAPMPGAPAAPAAPVMPGPGGPPPMPDLPPLEGPGTLAAPPAGPPGASPAPGTPKGKDIMGGLMK